MRFFLATLVTLLVGCVGVAPHVTRSVYDPAEIAWSQKKGTASIEGNAFMRQQNGGLIKCSGQEVLLVAAGAYANERMHALFVNFVPNKTSFNNSRGIDVADGRYLNDVRSVTCDVDGKFEFEDLPEGIYYLSTAVTWRVGNTVQGGAVAQRFSLSVGEHKKITMHR